MAGLGWAVDLEEGPSSLQKSPQCFLTLKLPHWGKKKNSPRLSNETLMRWVSCWKGLFVNAECRFFSPKWFWHCGKKSWKFHVGWSNSGPSEWWWWWVLCRKKVLWIPRYPFCEVPASCLPPIAGWELGTGETLGRCVLLCIHPFVYHEPFTQGWGNA